MLINLFSIFMRLKVALFFILIGWTTWSQQTKEVFFIGNSYTNTGNIPELIKQIAASAGDHLNYTAHTPGGTTLQQHASNPVVAETIEQGHWDYVVLQEQSQLPSFPAADVNNMVMPFAAQLSNKIKQSNPCTKVTFYMTWGRKYGDAQNCPMWPPVCTYEGMDDLIHQTYISMAEANNGIVSPVGAVWRYLINNYPDLDLYSNDESHPSLIGSMASAYTFFSVFFKKSPYESNFTNSLPIDIISAIKEAVEKVVFKDLDTWDFSDHPQPFADFDYTISNNTVQFTNNSSDAMEYLWEFGDGSTDSIPDPNHTYSSKGSYVVRLTVTNCDESHTTEKVIDLGTWEFELNLPPNVELFPNPAKDYIYINTKSYPLDITIFDMKGSRFYATYKRRDSAIAVDLRHLSPGGYILFFKTQKETKQFRFIKTN